MYECIFFYGINNYFKKLILVVFFCIVIDVNYFLCWYGNNVFFFKVWFLLKNIF